VATQLPKKRGHSNPPIFGPCLLWPNGWMDQAATWYGGRSWPRRHCVTWGPCFPPPPEKMGGTQHPQILAHILWPNDWIDQNATWYGGRPQPRPHCVTWGPSSPPKKGHSSPQFSAHVCCRQTAGWLKIPLGSEVCLGPGHIVLDGDPPPKGTAPNLWPMSVLAKRQHGSRCHLVWRQILALATLC